MAEAFRDPQGGFYIAISIVCVLSLARRRQPTPSQPPECAAGSSWRT